MYLSFRALHVMDFLADLVVTQHDAVLDYYGRRLATCSSDKMIKIFEIDGETHRLTETLKGWAKCSLLAFRGVLKSW